MKESTAAELLEIIPVLPSSDIARDIKWYKERVGFECLHFDDMYAVLRRENICIQLQCHADTSEDPLLGGSVIKIFARNINALFEEIVERRIVDKDAFVANTAWGTNEFGFFDLNNNAIFIVKDID